MIQISRGGILRSGNEVNGYRISGRDVNLRYCTSMIGARQKAALCADGSSTVTWQS